MTTKTKLRYFLIVAVLMMSAGVAYTFLPAKVTEASAEGQKAPQAMPVDTEEVAYEKVQVWKNFSGRVVAVDRAEIRPQVSGIITEIKFEDGQYVEKGDVLIVIDPRPYEAALSQAKAELHAAQTQANLAEKEYQRAKNLINSNAISQSLLDERLNNRQSSSSSVQAAEARVLAAEINLDYASIKAPISGKISRAEVTEGNLVQSNASPLLTSIVSDEKIYIDFEIDERTYLDFVKQNKGRDATEVPVRVTLLDSSFEYNGFIHSFDNRIERASGTLRARALLDNKERILLPGMTVSVRMGSSSQEEQIIITERAIGTDQDRKFVFVLGDDGTAQYREVKIGESIDGKRIILSGLKKGEHVIKEGLAKIRPGMPVVSKSSMKQATAPETKAKEAEKE